jgi:hypothetical protein
VINHVLVAADVEIDRQQPNIHAGIERIHALGLFGEYRYQRSIVAVRRIFFCNKSTP